MKNRLNRSHNSIINININNHKNQVLLFLRQHGQKLRGLWCFHLGRLHGGTRLSQVAGSAATAFAQLEAVPQPGTTGILWPTSYQTTKTRFDACKGASLFFMANENPEKKKYSKVKKSHAKGN